MFHKQIMKYSPNLFNLRFGREEIGGEGGVEFLFLFFIVVKWNKTISYRNIFPSLPVLSSLFFTNIQIYPIPPSFFPFQTVADKSWKIVHLTAFMSTVSWALWAEHSEHSVLHSHTYFSGRVSRNYANASLLTFFQLIDL